MPGYLRSVYDPADAAEKHLGSSWVIEATDLDVALALAAEGSEACRGTVEVRRFRSEEPVRTPPVP
ncbi:hypothetical protein ACFQZ8_00960 [Micromonospora azadirachtae]|uniref:YCII-related domain-containing protein n=1 Tax=Micromonospora azadirachtae TaxID=1970735 RepID=A0ABW2ZVS1_9ACTN